MVCVKKEKEVDVVKIIRIGHFVSKKQMHKKLFHVC
jgi:hypothetical protein